VLRAPAPAGRVPHLVELPLSFQKSVPDLTFNSHIYASDPFASRVMINSNYLRRGDSFSGLRVESITQDGVVLSKQGQRFRVGIVRDWVSPR
ncbi:general secretion pathway protein GspB, partial [Marinobacter alexandrii]